MEAVPIPKIVTKKNLYVFLSIAVIFFLSAVSALMYKNYLVEKVAQKTYDAVAATESDFNKIDTVDKISLMNQLKSFLKSKSIMELHRANKISGEEVISLMKEKLK